MPQMTQWLLVVTRLSLAIYAGPPLAICTNVPMQETRRRPIIVGGDSTVTCHLCGTSTCDLYQCANAGDSSSSDYCWCENAVYIACRNSGESCPSNLPTGNSASAINACSVCSFDNTMDRSNWDITLSDSA